MINDDSAGQVKDVRVPAQLMRAMAAEAEAAREARAKVIMMLNTMMMLMTRVMTRVMMAMVTMMVVMFVMVMPGDSSGGGTQGESSFETRRRCHCRLSCSLAGIKLNTHQAEQKAKHHHHPPQLRYLQTLNSISAENNSTIIFPVPVDIIADQNYIECVS